MARKRTISAARAVARSSSPIRSATSTLLLKPALRRLNPKSSRRVRSTPAPCILRSCRRARAIAPSAAWRWSPRCRPADAGRESRTGRFHASPLDRRCPHRRRSCHRHGPGCSACRCTAGLSPQAQAGSNWSSRRPSCCGAGWPFLVRGWASIVNRSPNMWTLISHRHRRRPTSTASSRCSRPGCSRRLPMHDGTVGRVLRGRRRHRRRSSLLGQMLELKARSKTLGSAIRALLDLAPKTARRIARDGSEDRRCRSTTSMSATAARAARREGAGRWVVVEGSSAVDESMLTGEPMPVEQAPGDKRHRRHAEHDRHARHAGREGRRATPCWRRSSQMVAQAQRSRAPIQRMADRVAGYFVPAVIVIAVLAFFAWLAFGPEPQLGLCRRDSRVACSSSRARARSGLPRRSRSWSRPGAAHARACSCKNAEALGAAGDHRYPHRRQDRHAHRRQARRSTRRRGARLTWTKRAASPGRKPGEGQRASAGRGHRPGRRGTRAAAVAAGTASNRSRATASAAASMAARSCSATPR